MNPSHWLDAADQLVNEARPGAPRQVNLRCAVSMVYYALFHWLANCVADVLAGATRPTDHGWVRVYRGVDHRQVKQQCRQGRIPTHLAPTLRRFAAELAEMQGRRQLGRLRSSCTLLKARRCRLHRKRQPDASGSPGNNPSRKTRTRHPRSLQGTIGLPLIRPKVAWQPAPPTIAATRRSPAPGPRRRSPRACARRSGGPRARESAPDRRP